MIYHIFDLDGTIIDSRHRYKSLPCGNIDLDHWHKNASNKEITFQDKLLPLAQTARRKYYEPNNYVIFCTSRTINPIWVDFLDHHKLFCDALLARPEGLDSDDADLKEYMLDEFFDGLGTCLEAERVVMYEDHLGVIDRMRSRGVLCSISRN